MKQMTFDDMYLMQVTCGSEKMRRLGRGCQWAVKPPGRRTGAPREVHTVCTVPSGLG